MTASRTLVVVHETVDTCARFLPLPAGRRLVFSYGTEVPDGPGLSYWTWGGHAARLVGAGLAPALAAPPPDWESTIDADLLGRAVVTVPLGELPLDQGPLFVKPADFKVRGLGAAVWDPAQFVARALQLGVLEQSLVQYTATVLDLDLEHRFVVADGEVLTGSPYLIAGVGYHPAMASPRFADAEAYARRVVSALGTECPPAMCLDVGWDRVAGRWVVVEANALWSSGMYGCDAQAFTLGVEVANSAGHGRWAWTPDIYQRRRAESLALVHAVPQDEASAWMPIR